ncbi:MAG: Sua5/YciO/YrdC/YwlC family protein [Nitriliruptoraceae bacterium]
MDVSGRVLVCDPPVERTTARIDPSERATHVATMLNVLYDGRAGIAPLDVAYAIVGSRETAIKRIFAAKRHSYEKPSGLLSTWEMSQEIHLLSDDKHDMIRTLIVEDDLPFSVVAPFDSSHPFFQVVDLFVIKNSIKAQTLDMLLNAGQFHDELARQSFAHGKPVFGSSANTSLTGSKYRFEDVDAEVREAADLSVDYGMSRYANRDGRSSTIIDFRDFTVIRPGVEFPRICAAFATRYGVTLTAAN